MRGALACLLVLATLPGCQQHDAASGRRASARDFPSAVRPVSQLAGNSFSSEDQRDQLNEANSVMDLAALQPGMTVADIGAGDGYYTVRLAARVGARGRVLAQDIDRAALQRLGVRLERDRLDNVAIKSGAEDDPRLPPSSFDRIFLIHMYHEIAEPYAFLWRMRPALRPGGRVVVVDIDRPTDRHGIAPRLLFCEFGAVGFRLRQFSLKPELQGYYAEFEATGERPAPDAIKPCGQDANGAAPPAT